MWVPIKQGMVGEHYEMLIDVEILSCPNCGADIHVPQVAVVALGVCQTCLCRYKYAFGNILTEDN